MQKSKGNGSRSERVEKKNIKVKKENKQASDETHTKKEYCQHATKDETT